MIPYNMQITSRVCVYKKRENKREKRDGNGEFAVGEGSFHCFCFCFVFFAVQFAFSNLVSKSHLCMHFCV